MVKSDRFLPTDDQLAKNPAVNLKLVHEAYRVRKELDDLGVWEDSGSRVRSPFEMRPDLEPHGRKMEQLISQNWRPSS